MDFLHISVRSGGCLLRGTAILTRVQVRRVPIPPVMFGVRLLVLTMVFLRIAEELCKSCDVHGVCLRRLPFAAGKSRRDFL
jgi:hypothetical protein